MLKLIFDILFGNWCKHEWEIFSENGKPCFASFSPSGCITTQYQQYNKKILLCKCKKCGKLVTKRI